MKEQSKSAQSADVPTLKLLLEQASALGLEGLQENSNAKTMEISKKTFKKPAKSSKTTKTMKIHKNH